MQPAKILMALALWIVADKGPEIIRREMVTDHHLLTVDDIIIAVADRFGLAIGDVTSAVGLRQHLPNANFGACDRRQEFTFLLFRPPPNQYRRDNACQRIEHMRQVQRVPEE